MQSENLIMNKESKKFNEKKLDKIVINVGIGRLSQQPNFEEKILPEVANELALITGQKPAVTRAKKSIAGFRTRAGQIVGLKVTLRKKRMFDFLERLSKIVLPRLRDFRGIKLSNIDAGGNLTIGMKEQVVFPEINPEISKINFGMEITIVSNVRDHDKAVELYRALNVPLKKK